MQTHSNLISFNNFNSIHSVIRGNISLSLANADSMPQAEFSSLLRGSGIKDLEVSIGESSVNQALAIMNSAKGKNTTISLDAAEGYPMTSMPQIIEAVGDREWSVTIRGDRISHLNAVSMIRGFANAKASFTLSTFNAMPEMAVSALLDTIGKQAYTVTMDAMHSSPSKIIDSIKKISSDNVEISIENTGFIPVAVVSQVMSAVGERKCTITFDVLYFNALSLKLIIPSCGTNTSIIIETSQALRTSELLEIMRITAPRRLVLGINGRQFTIDPANGDKINQVIAAANSTHTISINTAQYPKLGYLLPLIENSGNTNLVLTYNGAQITDIEGVGNVVVRGIKAAQPTTTIRVNSVGAGRLNSYLEIIQAANK